MWSRAAVGRKPAAIFMAVLRSAIKSAYWNRTLVWTSHHLSLCRPRHPFIPWRSEQFFQEEPSWLKFSPLSYHVCHFRLRLQLWYLNKRKGRGIGVCLLPLSFLMDQNHFSRVSDREEHCIRGWLSGPMGNLPADVHVVVIFCNTVFSIVKSTFRCSQTFSNLASTLPK